MAEYKRRHHGDLSDGLRRATGRSYPHILPESEQRLNILPSMRENFWAYYAANKGDLALHTDFHHLNSSQAFAFNAFYLWMQQRSAQQQFLKALGVRQDELVRWHFEHMPDPSERTTFDFYGKYADGARLFVEVKLTEGHFGLAQNDEKHRIKRSETYLPRLEGKADPRSLAEANFFLNYQLFRNLSHLDVTRGDQLVFLVPQANAFTWSQAVAFADSILPALQPNVHVVAAEDLLSRLTAAAEEVGGSYAQHIAELSDKYLPSVTSSSRKEADP